MQTILGAGGVIGDALAKELINYTTEIRLVSRNPKKINKTDSLMSADLMNATQVNKAVEGSEVVYLMAGLPYNIKTWREKWPAVMQNTIDACKKHGAKLVFFDNVYMLGKVDGPMTENSPLNPNSKKGEVRAKLNHMILDEIKGGKLQAIIARSADFYGPGAKNSLTDSLIFAKLAKSKKPSWLLNDTVKHSFTFTPDAAKGTAILGNTPSAYNQIWHLPTHRDALTGKEFIKICEEAFGEEKGYQIMGNFMLWAGGLFVPIVKELKEMAYQNEFEYLFDSSKFEKTFNFKPTPYREGIMETAKSYQ
ncbi:NAD-dependent epimerase/dehydratase family protein [Emticicia sp.]|uniref:NAD-dependent epimerase/dehydratase family protein n=1 Tax=Emticicia sp. TaxID=1930953 RepID=UPI003752F48C